MVWLLIITTIIGMVGASLGVFFIGFVRDSKTADAGAMLFVILQLLLSGAIIPITYSEGILSFLAKIMPINFRCDVVQYGEEDLQTLTRTSRNQEGKT